MANRISDKTRLKKNRGTGSHKDYIPWIKIGDISSIGTKELVKDWITKREVHLLSQAEAYVYQILRFSEAVDDIQEQYPLPLAETRKIAEELGIKHPEYLGKPIVMTTDFLVKYKNNTYEAISVKTKESDFQKQRVMEKLLIEKTYWDNNHVKIRCVSKDSINVQIVNNIRLCSYFYDLPKGLFDEISLLKHLIIRHIITPDMEKPLNFKELLITYKKEVDEWKNHYLIDSKFLPSTVKNTGY